MKLRVSDKNIKCLIVGCGRSGTGLVANILNQNGIFCGHEKIFNSKTNINNIQNFSFESSWLSAPFIDDISDLTHIIHIVREPDLVIESFMRLGVFSLTPFRQITMGYPLRFIKKSIIKPGYFLERFNYVVEMRRFLRNNSRIFENYNEAERIEEYWRYWNEIIEKKSNSTNAKYKVFTIDSIILDPKILLKFLDLDINHDIELKKINSKNNYNKRKKKYSLSSKTIIQAKKYGLTGVLR